MIEKISLFGFENFNNSLSDTVSEKTLIVFIFHEMLSMFKISLLKYSVLDFEMPKTRILRDFLNFFVKNISTNKSL